jgi:hypothetical protein
LRASWIVLAFRCLSNQVAKPLGGGVAERRNPLAGRRLDDPHCRRRVAGVVKNRGECVLRGLRREGSARARTVGSSPDDGTARCATTRVLHMRAPERARALDAVPVGPVGEVLALARPALDLKMTGHAAHDH